MKKTISDKIKINFVKKTKLIFKKHLIKNLVSKLEDKADLKKVIRLYFNQQNKRKKSASPLDKEAIHMITGVLDVGNLHVRDVMLPITKADVIKEDEELKDVLNKVIETNHSRYPVIDIVNNKIIGILLAKDILSKLVEKKLKSIADLQELYRKPIIVPESKRLNILLHDFKHTRSHLAVVTDEYSNIAGIITIEDIIEQIIGDIRDEHDEKEVKTHKIRHHFHNTYSTDALVSLEEVNKEFGLKINDKNVDTLAGLISKLLGRVPKRGDEILIDETGETVIIDNNTDDDKNEENKKLKKYFIIKVISASPRVASLVQIKKIESE